jgi:aryl sulfotransferase
VTTWPAKQREFHNHHFDSTIWNDFRFRDGDIVISTYAKSGTTWMQQMIGQMLFGPDPELAVAELSPWLDLRVPPKAEKLPLVEAQTRRHFLKTHLPVDALVYSPQARYVYIGCDGRDVVWSMYNHHANANAGWYAALNDTPGRVGPPIEPPPGDVLRYFRDWMEADGHPFWPFWENLRSWWAIRELPNLHLVQFNDLKRDLAGEMRKLARYLEIDVAATSWPRILEYCSFDWMKANTSRSVPLGGAFWDGGAHVFIHRGENGRWQRTLPAAESAAYEARALRELGADCAHWLATGERRS